MSLSNSELVFIEQIILVDHFGFECNFPRPVKLCELDERHWRCLILFMCSN